METFRESCLVSLTLSPFPRERDLITTVLPPSLWEKGPGDEASLRLFPENFQKPNNPMWRLKIQVRTPLFSRRRNGGYSNLKPTLNVNEPGRPPNSGTIF
jgi:hypothetical protein